MNYESMIDRGMLPDWLIRYGIRRQLRQRLRTEDRGSPESNTAHLEAYVERLRQAPIAARVDAANEQHYEVSALFYQQALGRHLKYSSGYWAPGVTTLDEAEAAMLQLATERAGIEDGMRVLDLGCGWGSMTLWMAERFPQCQITSVSNSASQKAFIDGRCAALGLTNVEVVTCDANDFAPTQRFDRVVSIEMFEHMQNYERLLRRIAGWLTEEGRLFVHIFVHRQFAYPFEDAEGSSWMGRHFFTGGQMPSDDLLLAFDDDLELEERWRVNGTHYAKTARAWLENVDAKRGAALAALREGGLNGESNAMLNRWRVFFMACEELWGYGAGNEWYVSHYLFRPRVALRSAIRPGR